MPLTNTEMDAFLAERHTVVVATLQRSGAPQLSTTWYRWDGQALWISTNRNRAKYRNLRRDPRVTVLVDDPPAETSVVGYGRAEMAAVDEAAYEGALAIVGRYVDDPVGYLAEREGEPRVLIRIRLDKVISWKPDDERR
ncbi:MAG: PPOX class F420-dependent oxidoreductase [Chloroflexi bacterium]|nr:PPOX class F420-dependent oxidoreductase [Chloroflexota bacterium]